MLIDGGRGGEVGQGDGNRNRNSKFVFRFGFQHRNYTHTTTEHEIRSLHYSTLGMSACEAG